MDRIEADVVVVGGGIAGSSLAAVLAEAGVRVSVLERTTTFPDRVRGEMWTPWGVAHLQSLGLVDTLLDAGGFFSTRWAFYDERIPAPVSEQLAVDVSTLLPGVPGMINVRHPVACEALNQLAIRRGVDMHRGVVDVEMTTVGAGAELRRVVRWRDESGREGEIIAALLVGADGRTSAVRKHFGIELECGPIRHHMTGGLVEGPRPLSKHVDSYGTGRDVNWYAFPQGPASARVYFAHFDVHRYAGTGGDERFLADLAQCASPDIAMLAEGTLLAPIATHSSIDTWTQRPFVEGGVLVGDSAGYNDPIIGQGLSLAMADVRDVTAAILEHGVGADFTVYGTARFDRHAKQRLAAQTMAELMCSFSDDDAMRRLRSLPLLGSDAAAMAMAATMFVGPHMLPMGIEPLLAAREVMLAA